MVKDQSKICWYLTPAFHPTVKIAGPWDERKLAVRESIKRLSFEAKQSAAEALRMPNLLVPTPVRISGRMVDTFKVISATESDAGTSAKDTNKAPKYKLPEQIFKLNQKQLYYLCSQLSVDGVVPNMGKQELISLLEKELSN